MTRNHYKPVYAALSVLVLLAMTLLLSPCALADGGATAPEAADTITIDSNGQVTLFSDHLAGEEASSLQLRLAIDEEAKTGTIGFQFAVSGERLLNHTVTSGAVPAEDIPENEDQTPVDILTIYIAGAEPLMAPGQTQLLLGTVTGALPDGISVLEQDGLQVVYGTRMASVTTAFSSVKAPEPEQNEAGEALEKLLAEAAALDKDAYTSDSWQALMDAADAASRLLDDDTATEEQLEQAAAALRSAMDRLVLADRADLANAIAAAEKYLATLDPGKYTEDSYAALVAAISQAKTLLNDPDAAAEQLAEALQKLSAPEKLLVPSTTAEGGGTLPDNPDVPGETDTDPADETATPAPTAAPTAVPTATPFAVPNTGDETALLPWAAMLCLCCGMLAGLMLRRGKTRG